MIILNMLMYSFNTFTVFFCFFVVVFLFCFFLGGGGFIAASCGWDKATSASVVNTIGTTHCSRSLAAPLVVGNASFWRCTVRWTTVISEWLAWLVTQKPIKWFLRFFTSRNRPINNAHICLPLSTVSFLPRSVFAAIRRQNFPVGILDTGGSRINHTVIDFRSDERNV